jgi:hypothetical protein
MTGLHELPEQFRVKDFGVISCETNEFHFPSEENTEKSQTSSSVSMTSNLADTPKSGKPQKGPPGKNIYSFSEPLHSKVQMSKNHSILVKLESQIQSLTRQVQSCNSRINHFASTSSNLQSVQPLSKSKKINSGKKKVDEQTKAKSVLVSSKAKSFVKSSIEPTKLKFDKTPMGESSEPISRWVLKSDQ